MVEVEENCKLFKLLLAKKDYLLLKLFITKSIYSKLSN